MKFLQYLIVAIKKPFSSIRSNKFERIDSSTARYSNSENHTFKTIFTPMDKIIESMDRMTLSVSNIMNSKTNVLDSIQNISVVSQQSAATSGEIFDSTLKQMSLSNELAEYTNTLQLMSDALEKAISIFKI
jgi:methyl-accepting chemotaxis protein